MKTPGKTLTEWAMDEIRFNGRVYTRRSFEDFWKVFVESYSDPSMRHEIIESRGDLYRAGYSSDTVSEAVERFFTAKRMLRYSSFGEAIKAWRRYRDDLIRKAPKVRRRTL